MPSLTPDQFSQLLDAIKSISAASTPAPSAPSSHKVLDKYDSRLRETLKLRSPLTLQGESNYYAWRSSLLNDARLIQATDVLQPQPDDMEELEAAKWQIRNDVFFARISTAISATVATFFQHINNGLAHTLWTAIESVYRKSIAHERCETLRSLFSLRATDGSFHQDLRKFRQFSATLSDLFPNDISDLLHDAFLITFSNVQKEWMGRIADQYFRDSRRRDTLSQLE